MSKNYNKKGQVKASEVEAADVDDGFLFQGPSPLDLDPTIIAELQAKGLEYRFVNAVQYQKNFGYHKSGWRVYQIEQTPDTKRGSLNFTRGVDPEGYVRFGDLVLAVKEKAEQESHRRKIKRRTQLQSDSEGKTAEELRDLARKGGLKHAEIVEGYDDN